MLYPKENNTINALNTIFSIQCLRRQLNIISDRIVARTPASAFPLTQGFLWAPAQRKRATMLYFANVFFKFIFFNGRLILRPWLTEVRENFTRGGP